MQIKYTHTVRGRRTIAGMSAAAIALFAAIAAAAATAAPIEPHVVTPTSVTPHAVTPHVATPAAAPQASQAPSPTQAPAPAAAPSPSSGAPAQGSGPAPTPGPVRGSRRQTPSGSSPADDSPDEGDLPDPKDPACDLDCQRQWLAWYTAAYQAAWFKSEDGVPGATELAQALTRDAREIENEIKAETATDDDDGDRITDNNPGVSAGGDPQAADPSQSTDSSADDSTDDTDLGSWDFSWITTWADDIATLNQEIFGPDDDTPGDGQPFDPSSVTPDGDTRAGADWGSPLGSEPTGSGDSGDSGDSSNGGVDIAPLADMFDIGPAIGGGSIPDPNKLLAD
jgi:hypothetical protein